MSEQKFGSKASKLIYCAILLLPITAHANGLVGIWQCGKDRIYEFTDAGVFKIRLGKNGHVISEGKFSVSGATIQWRPRDNPYYQPESFTGPINGQLVFETDTCNRVSDAK